MRYARPKPFREAIAASEVRTLLPTSMGSRELEGLSAEIRERARFSARVTLAEHLDLIDGGTNELVAGTTDLASARLRLKQFLRQIGYEPDPEQAGGLRDFLSDRRINLQLLTNVQQAQGYGSWQQGQQPELLDAFPAREFLRVEGRRLPRGLRRGRNGAVVPDPENAWPGRWDRARAATRSAGATESDSGRMIALVNHPIWVELSRFRTPYEPFDFRSGMGVEDVNRDEAMGLDLIDRDTQIPPQTRPFNQDLQAKPSVQALHLRQLLEASGVGRFDQAGVFHATAGGGS